MITLSDETYLPGPKIRLRRPPGSGPAGLYAGNGAPTTMPATARSGATQYVNLTNGDFYTATMVGASMQWSLTGNIAGPPGDSGELSPEEIENITEDVSESVLASVGDTEADFVAIFEDGLLA